MAYNLSVVRDNVRNRLDDDDYEQEFLDRAINYAQWEITNKHHLSFMESSSDLNVAEGVVDVSLPTDYHESLYLILTSPNDNNVRANLTENRMNYEDFLNWYLKPSVNPPSQPLNWSEYARKIKLAAPADKSYTLTLDYLRSSAKLVDDLDVPDIPEEFGELLEIGAYMRIAKREDDYDVKSQEAIDYTRQLIDLLHVYGRNKLPGGMRKMRVR